MSPLDTASAGMPRSTPGGDLPGRSHAGQPRAGVARSWRRAAVPKRHTGLRCWAPKVRSDLRRSGGVEACRVIKLRSGRSSGRMPST